MSTGTNFSVTPPPQTDPITSDNMINGMIGNEGIVGVVKRHKKGDHGRHSTQGSGREEAHLRSSSSSSGDDDEIHDKRRRKGQRKPRHTIFPMDDEDDERTDSASEGMEIDTSDTQHIKGYNLQLAKFPTTRPATSILKPLSPMLTVGYGGDLVVSHTTHHQDNCGTPTLDSPHNSDGHISSSGILSPEISIAPQGPSPLTSNHDNCGTTLLPLATTPVIAGTGNIHNGSNSVLSSSSITAAANALPFAGWWGQPTMYSPFCGPGGSVATTPVGTDATAYLRSGTSVYLRAVICHESDGVLIVNVHWRNKSFSGSLIDINQHQWAPPRLSEGIPDLSIQLKDLYSKQDSEKEPVDVVIDEEKEDEDEEDDDDEGLDKEEVLKNEEKKMIGEANEIRQDNLVVKAPPIENHLSDISDVSDNENNPKVSQPSSVLLSKPPNGLQVPSIITSEKSIPKPLLPSFDAVKSPQPEIGRDDKDPHKVSSKKDDVITEPRPVSPGDIKPVLQSTYISPVVHSSETHHNLNTLVDVATKMKPVSKETQHIPHNKTKKHSERNKSYGYRVSSGQNPALISGSGHESDSSGSGSISPVRKKPTKQLKDNKLLTGGGTNLKVPRDESSRQPDTPAFGNMPFQFDLSLQPISPGDDNSEKDHHPVKKINSSIKSGTDSYPSGQWGGPFAHKDPKPNIPNIVVPSSIMEFNNTHQPSHSSDTQPFAMPTTFGQPPSVIQDKKRKRKTATPNNESNKRPSPPLRDQDTHIEKSLPPLPPSLAKNPVGRDTNVIQGHDHMKSPELLAGFVYDPSLPMTYEYQLIAFQRQKAAEEKQADRNMDSKTPPRVIKQPHHVDHLLPYETTPQSNRQHSPLPPPHSGTFGRNKVVAPGVLISPDQRAMNPHSLPIKQEQLPRPNRPSSKGNHIPSTLKPPSHQPKKQSSRRLESHQGGIQIKQEPESLAMSHHHHQPGFLTFPGFPLPPGSTPTFQALSQGIVTSAPPSSSSGVLQGVSVVPPPAWHVSGIMNPPSSLKSEPHTVRNQQEHHMARMNTTTRTPSPNSHKKPHDWHHHGGIHHVITNKHEPQTSRHYDSKQMHPMVSSSHATSSAGRSQHGTKHDSSSRHIHTPSSHQPPPPTTPATITQLSPTHIAALHGNGLSVEEWLKQVQLMQHLEAIQKSGGVVAPTAIHTHVHPQEFALWQNQMAQFAAMGQVPVDQATAIQMQLAIQQQQQQQQQQTQALAAQGLIPLMQPFSLGTPAVVPFTALPPPPVPKRDS